MRRYSAHSHRCLADLFKVPNCHCWLDSPRIWFSSRQAPLLRGFSCDGARRFLTSRLPSSVLFPTWIRGDSQRLLRTAMLTVIACDSFARMGAHRNTGGTPPMTFPPLARRKALARP
jgi:hypothetical protein